MKYSSDISRKKILDGFHILDTEREGVFDELTNLAASICQTKYSAITIIDDHRQWFKSTYGFDLKETPLKDSICQSLLNQYQEGLYIPDLLENHEFKNHPALINSNTRFYAGYPIKTNSGFILGSLCVFDEKPKTLNKNHLGLLKVFANQAMKLISLNQANYQLGQKQKDLSQWIEAVVKVAKNSGLGGFYLNNTTQSLVWGPSTNSMFRLKEGFELSFEDFKKKNFSQLNGALKYLLETIHNFYIQNIPIKITKDHFLNNINKVITLSLEYDTNVLTVAFIDNTKNHELKQKLQSYKTMMNQVERIAKIGGFEYNINNDRVKFTSNSFKIFELKETKNLKFSQILKLFEESSQEDAKEDLEYSILNKTPYNSIRKVKLESGKNKYIKISSNPIIENKIVTSFIGSIHDITEEYSLEEQLKETKNKAEKVAAFFKSIVENNQLFVLILNHHLELEYCNSYYQTFFNKNYHKTGSIQKSEIEKKFTSMLMNSVGTMNSGQKNYEFKSIDQGKDSKAISILWNFSKIEKPENGEELFVFVGLDITEMEENKSQINQLVDLASTQSKALLDFNNIISHNIRGEVSNLHGLITLIELVDDQEERDIYFNLIKKCTENLDGILYQLNKFTTLGLSEPILKEPVGVLSLISKICKKLFSPVIEFDIHYEIKGPPNLIILSSGEYLERIFNLILTNCLQYRSDSRRLEVKIIAKQVDSNYLEIRVIDNGKGMDLSGGQERLFRLNHTYHQISGKKGFGLFFTNKLVEILEGTILIQSTVDKGTEVILKFPNHEF